MRRWAPPIAVAGAAAVVCPLSRVRRRCCMKDCVVHCQRCSAWDWRSPAVPRHLPSLAHRRLRLWWGCSARHLVTAGSEAQPFQSRTWRCESGTVMRCEWSVVVAVEQTRPCRGGRSSLVMSMTPGIKSSQAHRLRRDLSPQNTTIPSESPSPSSKLQKQTSRTASFSLYGYQYDKVFRLCLGAAYMPCDMIIACSSS